MAENSAKNDTVAEINTKYYESNAYTEMKLINFQFTWVIKNYSFCVQNRTKRLISPIFPEKTNDVIQWRLELIPYDDIHFRKFISIYLTLCNSLENNNIQATFKIGILNALMERINTKQSDVFTFELETSRGFRSFIKDDILFDPSAGNLTNDTLTLFCEVSVATHMINKSYKLSVPNPICTLPSDFGVLLKNQTLSDVVLCSTDGKEFKSHKAILSARSSVFEAMFSHDTTENRNNRVKITDIDHEVLKEMLSYIYTGETPCLNKFPTELLYAADKYDLKTLQIMCVKELYQHLCIDNVANVFQVAYTHDLEQLKQQAKDFLVTHASEVFKTAGWKSMALTHPHLVGEVFSD